MKRSPTPSSRAAARRAFALPLVIGIAVIAAALITALLTRQSSRLLLQQRHIDTYFEHHAFKGLEESITAWINSNGTQSILQALDDNGKAFELELADGQKLVVYFSDAQGKVLGRFSGLADQDLDDAAGLVDALRLRAGSRAKDMLRMDGPFSISLKTADPDAIQAACSIVAGPDARRVASALLALRDEKDLTPEALGTALAETGLAPDLRARLLRLITIDPVFYEVWIEAWAPGWQEPISAYRGWCLAGGRGGVRSVNSIQRSSAFLRWERVLDPSAR